jgi:hypothetical protein
MRLVLVVLIALLSSRATAAADCTPADPKTIAEAEKAADDADFKAQQAESIAVRSGNSGAQARATQARAAATSARQHADALQCKATEAPATKPVLPLRGY